MQKEDILRDWAAYEGGIAGARKDWIESLANAGPSKYRGSPAEELYRVLVKSDANAAITRYAELKRDHPTEYPFEASLILRTGNWLLDKGRTTDAIKLLEFCVSEFPNSTRDFDKLGETYMNIGNKELATKNYETSLRLIPENENAEEMLKQLRSTR